MPDPAQLTATEAQLLREAILALRLYGCRVNATSDGSDFHRVNDGPALSPREIVALACDQGLMPADCAAMADG